MKITFVDQHGRKLEEFEDLDGDGFFLSEKEREWREAMGLKPQHPPKDAEPEVKG